MSKEVKERGEEKICSKCGGCGLIANSSLFHRMASKDKTKIAKGSHKCELCSGTGICKK